MSATEEDYAKAQTANSTDASFPSRPATISTPAYIDVLGTSLYPPLPAISPVLLIVPYGVGSENHTFDLRVLGWRKLGSLWKKIVLCELSCVLGTEVGVSGQQVSNTERFIKSQSLVVGNENVNIDLMTDFAVISIRGHRYVEFIFKVGSATSCNLLWVKQ